MRFFLEFVSCCGPATLRSADSTGSLQPTHEEERSLVPPPSRPLHRKKRGRGGTLPAKPEWRPSLGSISEDVVPQRQRQRADPRNGTAGSGRDTKRRSTSGAAAPAKAHHRDYSDDYGRAAMPAIIPAFSPTPFMF